MSCHLMYTCPECLAAIKYDPISHMILQILQMEKGLHCVNRNIYSCILYVVLIKFQQNRE